MSVGILPARAALAPGVTQPFSPVGGSTPFVFSVIPGNAGGTIDSGTGLYTAPSTTGFDYVKVTDNLGATHLSRVMVGNALELVCDILQTELELPDNHVYLWDQKIMAPKDDDLFIAVGIISCKPFGNTNNFFSDNDGLNQKQSINMQATLSIDIISRGVEARDRKEEVLMASVSDYAISQMELNSFYFAILPQSMVNLSQLDGAAIPYRFNIAANLQYFVTKTKPIAYYDTYTLGDIATDP